MVNYYRKFIKNFSQLLFPLHNRLKKNVKYVWSSEFEETFRKIKKEIISDPVLVHYSSDLPLILEYDI